MSFQSKIIDLLTICRKAGRLTLGFDAVCADARTGRAALILHTSDASAKTIKELNFLCNNVPVLKIPITRTDLVKCFRKEFAVLAICDEGFAKKITLLCGDNISES